MNVGHQTDAQAGESGRQSGNWNGRRRQLDRVPAAKAAIGAAAGRGSDARGAKRFGHNPIAIVGGGTGMIGDPSGKSQERTLLSHEQIEDNLAGIRRQLSRFLDFGTASGDGAPTVLNPARIVNNADWLGTIDLLS